MTDTDKSRFVATALGLYDPNRRTECYCDQKYGEPDNFYNEAGNRCHWHKAGPPPDLSSPAGADLLLRTLLVGHYVYFGKGARHGIIAIIDDDDRTETRGETWPEALLDAAYRLLKTDDRNAIEEIN